MNLIEKTMSNLNELEELIKNDFEVKRLQEKYKSLLDELKVIETQVAKIEDSQDLIDTLIQKRVLQLTEKHIDILFK